jgi:hypothetical protein
MIHFLWVTQFPEPQATALDKKANAPYFPPPRLAMPAFSRILAEVPIMIRLRMLMAPVLGLAAGCLPFLDRQETQTTLVPSKPFGTPPPPASRALKTNFAPASGELAERVDFLGHKIIGANPQIGCRPTFVTIGSPAPEVFHQGESMLYVTSGLVQQCKGDAELAAVLSYELGRIVSEREQRASPQARNPERRPPAEVQIGNAAVFNTPDQTHLVELAKFEKEHPRRPRILPRPDPNVLAKTYLTNAGYHKSDLDDVGPLLRSAEKNYVLEKQFKVFNPPAASWVPTNASQIEKAVPTQQPPLP